MIMTITADWLVAGDLLQTSNTEVDIKSANAADDALSRMMAGAAAFFADRAHDGNAEILRMAANELVMRGREDDAPTVSCARQP